MTARPIFPLLLIILTCTTALAFQAVPYPRFPPPLPQIRTSHVTAPRCRDTRLHYSPTYEVTRKIFMHSLGFIYGNAFMIAYNQNKALIGDEGITPARDSLSSGASAAAKPTLLRTLLRRQGSSADAWLDRFALMGMALSCVPLLAGRASLTLMAALWGLYLSIVNVGGPWYSYGWESQLLETGFLAAFSSPVLGVFLGGAGAAAMPPAWLPALGYRWLLFRVMMGSGLIKIR